MMPKIKIHPLDETIHARAGETVRDVIHRAGVAFDTPCNGDGLCGKCLIRVESPKTVRQTPHREITEQQSDEGLRLACQLMAYTDMTVRLVSAYIEEEHKILEKAGDLSSFAGERRITVRDRAVRPAVELLAESSKIRCRFEDGTEESLPHFQEGMAAKGLAIDLGTTTLVATLVSLKSGRELSTTSALNPQIRFGHDVVRRIQHGSTPEGLKELSNAVRDGMNRLIEQVCEDSNVSSEEILDVVIGGNTTMLQLAAGIDPEPLGQVPFTVGIEGGRTYPAERFDLNVHSSARVYVPPVLHAYVGADISAGLLVCPQFFSDDSRSILFVDIGTNGEMGLSAGGKLLMTSTAAGPAFEGMGISAGMRARIGAVEAVTTDRHSLKMHTIGNAPPEGICGSGIIDLTAALFKTGVVDTSGRMRRPSDTAGLPELVAYRMVDRDGVAAFHVGGAVYFTQEDIRQVQLAKSAIRAAIDILLDEAGIRAGNLESIVLAGGFGYSLRPENLETIGLIPPGTAGRVTFAGNTSRIGCMQMLRSTPHRRFLEERIGRMTHVSIETRPDFMEKYVEQMEFPENTDE